MSEKITSTLRVLPVAIHAVVVTLPRCRMHLRNSKRQFVATCDMPALWKLADPEPEAGAFWSCEACMIHRDKADPWKRAPYADAVTDYMMWVHGAPAATEPAVSAQVVAGGFAADVAERVAASMRIAAALLAALPPCDFRQDCASCAWSCGIATEAGKAMQELHEVLRTYERHFGLERVERVEA